MAGALPIVLLLIGSLVEIAHGGLDTVWVTCGSTIKLAHSSSNARLHSHEVAYSRGSQQQSVTCFPESDNGQSYWVVHGAVDAPCAPGQPIKKQQQIRLQHASTRKWLHSHSFYSPISGQQEVSAFGSDTQSDGGDVWSVEWDTKSKHWKQDAKVRMRHKDTGMQLSSNSNHKFGQPIHGHQEVCAISSKGRDTEWFAAEGVYLPRSDKKAKDGKAAGKDEL
ncbi:MIR motif-containing protein [Scenedesmus sp. NREL 46B-D3]|nr:MIR motif-containing protein [Scenedesmus sp. NREL 46B-D3]